MIKLKVDKDGRCHENCCLSHTVKIPLTTWAICNVKWQCVDVPTKDCPLYGQRDAEFEFDPRDTQRLKTLVNIGKEQLAQKPLNWGYVAGIEFMLNRIKELRGEK